MISKYFQFIRPLFVLKSFANFHTLVLNVTKTTSPSTMSAAKSILYQKNYLMISISMGLKQDFKDISAIKILVFLCNPVIVNSFNILSQNVPDKTMTNQILFTFTFGFPYNYVDSMKLVTNLALCNFSQT